MKLLLSLNIHCSLTFFVEISIYRTVLFKAKLGHQTPGSHFSVWCVSTTSGMMLPLSLITLWTRLTFPKAHVPTVKYGVTESNGTSEELNKKTVCFSQTVQGRGQGMDHHLTFIHSAPTLHIS